MSVPPKPPPKRKNHQTIAKYNNYSVGAGYNVPKNLKLLLNNNQQDNELSQYHITLNDIIPDTIIGKDIEIKGDFYYEKHIQILGKFQGKLLSFEPGYINIGKNACIISDVIIAKKMIIDGGFVIGKVVCDELLIINSSFIKGNITCKYIEMDGKLDITFILSNAVR